MFQTFYAAPEMNADLGAWHVSAVTTLENTFRGACIVLASAALFGAAMLAVCAPGGRRRAGPPVPPPLRPSPRRTPRQRAPRGRTAAGVTTSAWVRRFRTAVVVLVLALGGGERMVEAAALTDATFKQATWEWVNQVLSFSYNELGGGWCDDFVYLDGTRAPEYYPANLPSGNDLYSADRIQECLQRCVEESKKPGSAIKMKAFYVRKATQSCACSSGECSIRKKPTWATAYNIVVATATTKWGDIGDWDVSGAKDFSWAFSQHRDVGGSYALNGNPKVATFVGTAISKWNTASATLMGGTFYGASEMNADLTGWNVGKVVTLQSTFGSASKFAGTGLNSWDIASVAILYQTFRSAGEMNSDLSKWDVAKVTDMGNTFYFTTSLSTCNKRKIADAWKSSSVFVATTYDTDWAADTCPCPQGQAYASAATMCMNCVTGRFSSTTNDSPCVSKTTTNCTAGNEFTAGTSLLADDNTCSSCRPGYFKAANGDVLPCTPHNITSCSTGEGLVPGTATANDANCSVCSVGRFSSSIGGDACTPHTSPPCVAGSGSVVGTATADTSCAPCGSGKYSVDTDSSPCTNSSCPTGKYLGSAATEAQTCFSTCVPGKYKYTIGLTVGCTDCAPGTFAASPDMVACVGTECVIGSFGTASRTSSAEATCASCGQGTYSNKAGQTACNPHSVASCGAGKGYVAGTASVDNAGCIDCAAGMFNSNDDTSACADKTVTSCGAGKGYEAGTALADDAACSDCATGTLNGNDDKSACVGKAVTSCGSGQVLRPGSASADDASCVALVTPSPSSSPSPSSVRPSSPSPSHQASLSTMREAANKTGAAVAQMASTMLGQIKSAGGVAGASTVSEADIAAWNGLTNSALDQLSSMLASSPPPSKDVASAMAEMAGDSIRVVENIVATCAVLAEANVTQLRENTAQRMVGTLSAALEVQYEDGSSSSSSSSISSSSGSSSTPSKAVRSIPRIVARLARAMVGRGSASTNTVIAPNLGFKVGVAPLLVDSAFPPTFVMSSTTNMATSAARGGNHLRPEGIGVVRVDTGDGGAAELFTGSGPMTLVRNSQVVVEGVGGSGGICSSG